MYKVLKSFGIGLLVFGLGMASAIYLVTSNQSNAGNDKWFVSMSRTLDFEARLNAAKKIADTSDAKWLISSMLLNGFFLDNRPRDSQLDQDEHSKSAETAILVRVIELANFGSSDTDSLLTLTLALSSEDIGSYGLKHSGFLGNKSSYFVTKSIRESAHQKLCSITGKDYGFDINAWREWIIRGSPR